jgi:hypothetical protein
MGKTLLYGCGALLLVWMCVRAIAPMIQDYSWKHKWDVDREESFSKLYASKQAPVSVENIVKVPRGILQAAAVCNDVQLENRTKKMLLEFTNKLDPDRPNKAAAQVDAEAARAHNARAEVRATLKQDCHKTLQLAYASIVEFEK